jgi:hypothetical protein
MDGYRSGLPNRRKWCVVMQVPNRPLRSRQPIPTEKVERISLSLAAEDKGALEQIARDKQVSIAWVIQDAITDYLSDQLKKTEA